MAFVQKVYGHFDLEKSALVFGFVNLFGWLAATITCIYLMGRYAVMGFDCIYNEQRKTQICKIVRLKSETK